MAGKRGQFTVFVVLGFVLIAAFSFLLYARSLLNEEKIIKQANAVVDEAIASSNVNYYVEGCLNRVSDDAVYLMSLQGGRIYEYQGGTSPDPEEEGVDFINVNLSRSFYNVSFYNYTNVSYGIKPNYNYSCLKISAPDYPFTNISLNLIKSEYDSRIFGEPFCNFNSGAFGISEIPKLCDPNGSNRPDPLGDIGFYTFGTCKYGYDSEKNIQEELEHYVSNTMKKCVNFSIFENMGFNITVLNEPNTTVSFSEEFFIINISYPFTVQLGKRSVETKTGFEVKKNLRFKKFYEYVQALLDKEYKDIYFDIAEDYKIPELGWDSKIKVLKDVNFCNGCDVGKYDDLYQVIDNGTLIRGYPLIFQFAVKNRAPVIDRIDEGQLYNIVVKEGQTIELDPLGMDPDENLLIYNYSGWREIYSSTFQEQACLNNLANCRANPSDYVDINYTDQPMNWTESDIFQETKKNATYKVNRADLGLHYTQIIIYDEENKFDYQNISIMVTDIPLVLPFGENPYDDVNNGNASLEDPYSLNATEKSIFTDILLFKWEDDDEDFVFFTDNETVLLPVDVEASLTGIIPNDLIDDEIISFIFTELNPPTGLHEILVSGKYDDNGVEQWTEPMSMMIEVQECLPHRGSAAPYPYNNITGDYDFTGYDDVDDPFQANHTCCDDNFDITSGNICYQYKEYGSYYFLRDNHDKFTQDPFPTFTYIQTIPNGEYEDENDIWMRTFTRKCDGTRGNTCEGDGEQSVTNVDSCDDTGPDERCEGPPLTMLDTTLPNQPASCEQYTDTTFEKEFAEGTGKCDYDYACSGIGDGQYGSGGYYWCQATCGGGNCDKTTESICTDCRVESDQPAVDSEVGNPVCSSTNGNCPEFITDCYETGVGICDYDDGCTSEMPETFQEECDADLCPGPNCVFYEYYPANLNLEPPPAIMESCTPYTYDPDDYQIICENADNCRTPDGNHYMWIDDSCCGDNGECAYNNVCYPDGTTHPTNPSLSCDMGDWH